MERVCGRFQVQVPMGTKNFLSKKKNYLIMAWDIFTYIIDICL